MANTYTLIASSSVGSGGAASIDFTSIPSPYTDLCLKVSGRTSATNASYKVYDIYISINGSTTTFTQKGLEGDGSGAFSYSAARQVGWIPDAGATASTFGNLEIYIPNYAGSNNKSFSSDAVTENNGTSAYAALTAGLWSTTSAINQVTVTPASGNFVQYSTAYLYGIKSN